MDTQNRRWIWESRSSVLSSGEHKILEASQTTEIDYPYRLAVTHECIRCSHEETTSKTKISSTTIV